MDPSNPLPPINRSGLEAGLVEVLTLPATASLGPPARIQQFVQAQDGSDRFYALDTRGVVWRVEDGVVAPRPFLDLRSMGIGFVEPGSESGLRSIAFHPDFERAGTPGYGKVYTVHSASEESAQRGVPVFDVPLEGPATEVLFHDVLTEWTVADPDSASAVLPGSRRELFRVEEAARNHNLNQLLFDPNASLADANYGLLYVGVGDGGSYPAVRFGDPNGLAQDPMQIQGKILRIDPLATATARYGIPDDNPFADDPDSLPEIYALGFRNPQTLSFDNGGSGALFVGDIGAAAVEEINIVLAGDNYGWRLREGTFVYDRGHLSELPANDAARGLQYPIAQYDHQEIASENPFGWGNAAVAGGFVYRGTAVPELRGQYLFTDFPTGRIFHVPADGRVAEALRDGLVSADEFARPRELDLFVDGDRVSLQTFSGNAAGRVDLRFGTDEDGEIYVFSKQSGTVWRLDISGERFEGRAGADRLGATMRSDILEGRGGDDLLLGAGGNDHMVGGTGDDRLVGGAGADGLFGQNGRDALFGGAGRDRLDGGAARDILFGGDDADLFVIGRADSVDLIRDFSLEEGDQVRLSIADVQTGRDGEVDGGLVRLRESGSGLLLQVDLDDGTMGNFRTVVSLAGVDPAPLDSFLLNPIA